jgi:hypothetical protein
MKIDVAIRDIFKGSNLKIDFTIVDIPEGEVVDTVLFTVKRRKLDLDANAKIQKVITEESGPGTGLLENTSPPDGTASGEIHVTSDDWDNCLAGTLYFYDIKAVSSTGTPETLEDGTIVLRQPITVSTD